MLSLQLSPLSSAELQMALSATRLKSDAVPSRAAFWQAVTAFPLHCCCPVACWQRGEHTIFKIASWMSFMRTGKWLTVEACIDLKTLQLQFKHSATTGISRGHPTLWLQVSAALLTASPFPSRETVPLQLSQGLVCLQSWKLSWIAGLKKTSFSYWVYISFLQTNIPHF